ncbi:MAG: ferredoxin-thioredoxin reductase catalytic domain-containing protein [Nanoarchaeota archaeon]
MLNSKSEKELLKYAKKYAKSKGLKLNSNEKILNGIIKALMRNKEFKGDIYCPCRIVTGNKEKDKDIICPCVFHRGEIELQEHCKCNLFFK